MFPTKEIENKVLEFSETEDKAGLDEYAKSFDIKLDRRKSFDNMVEQFAKHVKDLPSEEDSSDKDESNESETTENGTDKEILDQEVSTQDESEEQPDGESSENLDSDDKPEEQPDEEPEVDESKIELDGFRPTFNLTFTDKRYGGEYANVGYWVIDEIQNNRVIEREWSAEAIEDCKHSKDVATILYYIRKDGKCLVRESRNSRFYKFTESKVKVAG